MIVVTRQRVGKSLNFLEFIYIYSARAFDYGQSLERAARAEKKDRGKHEN